MSIQITFPIQSIAVFCHRLPAYCIGYIVKMPNGESHRFKNIYGLLRRMIKSFPAGVNKSVVVGRSFIISLSVGILFGFTFAYVLFHVTEYQMRGISFVPEWLV